MGDNSMGRKDGAGNARKSVGGSDTVARWMIFGRSGGEEAGRVTRWESVGYGHWAWCSGSC